MVAYPEGLGPTRAPLHVSVDLSIGESAPVTLRDGSRARVRLLGHAAKRDSIRGAVREAAVDVELNGERATLASAMYRLPITVGGVQVDCPITADYYEDSNVDAWALRKDARLRLWPAGSPWVEPGTFGYPVEQRWFATDTQMSNDPCYVNACDNARADEVYYHYGLDIGGADQLSPVRAATDGVVIVRGEETIADLASIPGKPRYDLVYLLDDRGWCYRYSHLAAIAPNVKLGESVRRGDPLGVLGKEGASGGWSHLHFQVEAPQPSGEWGTEEGYAFLWQAYRAWRNPSLIAVARPHHLLAIGETATLDATRSWSAVGGVLHCKWTFTDGATARGSVVERRYPRPGYYTETVEVTDQEGNVGYDFAVVQVHAPGKDAPLAPAIHPSFTPTFDVRPGQPVTFLVRSFGTAQPGETWDFGDGSGPLDVRSDGNADAHNPDGYARCTHAYAAPGDYIATVTHTNEHGYAATGKLWVRVEA